MIQEAVQGLVGKINRILFTVKKYKESDRNFPELDDKERSYV